VFIGRIHTPWTSRMETPAVFGGSLVDQLATHGSLSGTIGPAV